MLAAALDNNFSGLTHGKVRLPQLPQTDISQDMDHKTNSYRSLELLVLYMYA